MATNLPNPKELTASMKIDFSIVGGKEMNLADFTEFEIMLGESLLTPGLQSSVSVNSYMHSIPFKNLDLFKNAVLRVEIKRDILKKYGITNELKIIQRIYRLENRT